MQFPSTLQNDRNDFSVEMSDVCRRYEGYTAIDNVSLLIERGCRFGLLGRNGSGKSTLLKLIAGLMKPTNGSVSVMGHNPFNCKRDVRQNIGYLSQNNVLPQDVTIGSLTRFHADLYPKWDDLIVNKLVSALNLDVRRSIAELPLGSQRGIAFALALGQRADVLILDEFAESLDVVVRRFFIDELISISKAYRPIIIVSSHHLGDVEQFADVVGIISGCRGITVTGPLDSIRGSIKRVRFHSFSVNSDKFSWHGAIRINHPGNDIVVTAHIPDLSSIDRKAREHGAQYEITECSLEDVFVAVETLK